MPTETIDGDLSAQLRDRVAHAEQYLAEALRAIQEAGVLQDRIEEDDEDETEDD